jgi:hypothetical protein
MSTPTSVGRAHTFEAEGCEDVQRLSNSGVRPSYPHCWMAMNSELPGLLDSMGELKDAEDPADAGADDMRLQRLRHQLRQAH